MAATVKIWRSARQPGVELLRADADQSHLTRVFRDAMGVTPAQYARGS